MKPSKDKIDELSVGEGFIPSDIDQYTLLLKLNEVIRTENSNSNEIVQLWKRLNKLESQPEEHKHESQNHRVNELGHTLIYCCSPKKECEWGIHDKCGYPWKFHEQRYDKVQCPKDSKKEGCATCGHRRNEHDLTGCTFIIATPFWRCKCSWNSMDDKEVIYTSEGDAVGEVGGKE